MHLLIIITTQVLWLGQPECYATWEPAVSVPHGLVQQYETGVVSESTVESVSLYGHVSNTLTISQQCSLTPEAKRMRQDRQICGNLGGYARAT